MKIILVLLIGTGKFRPIVLVLLIENWRNWRFSPLFLGRSSYSQCFHHRPIFRGEIRQFRQFPFINTKLGRVSPVPFFPFY
jgi:hypothetical protein